MKQNINSQFKALQNAIKGNVEAIRGLIEQSKLLTQIAEKIRETETNNNNEETASKKIFESVEKINDNIEKLDLIEQKQSEIFDKIKQKENQSLDHKLEDSRKEITKFFLSWFFWLIFGAFIFCYIYNLTFAVFFL